VTELYIKDVKCDSHSSIPSGITLTGNGYLSKFSVERSRIYDIPSVKIEDRCLDYSIAMRE
jgi:hypothetical protein